MALFTAALGGVVLWPVALVELIFITLYLSYQDKLAGGGFIFFIFARFEPLTLEGDRKASVCGYLAYLLWRLAIMAMCVRYGLTSERVYWAGRVRNPR